MKQDEAKGDVHQEFVGVFNPFDAPVGIGRHHISRRDNSGNRGEEGDHHCSTCRVVADIASGLHRQAGSDESEYRAWSVYEAREPGMAAADDTPCHTNKQKADDRVSREDMSLFPFVPCEVGEGKQSNQAPVKQPDQGVPDLDLRRRVHPRRLQFDPVHVIRFRWRPRRQFRD